MKETTQVTRQRLQDRLYQAKLELKQAKAGPNWFYVGPTMEQRVWELEMRLDTLAGEES